MLKQCLRLRNVCLLLRKNNRELKIGLKGSATPDVTGPAMEASSERIGKADGHGNTLDSEILEHLLTKNAV